MDKKDKMDKKTGTKWTKRTKWTKSTGTKWTKRTKWTVKKIRSIIRLNAKNKSRHSSNKLISWVNSDRTVKSILVIYQP